MQYRTMGTTGFNASLFGMGMMRLPSVDDKADFTKSTPLIHKAIDMGVNYFDTAYIYINGTSECTLKEAFKQRPGDRRKIKIATKLPMWHVDDNWEKTLDTSLERMGTDYVDFYLLHAIDSDVLEKHGDRPFKFLDDMVKKGKILYPSCSVHDDYEGFVKLADAYDWKMMQVQFNLMDVFHQVTLKGVEYAGKKDIPVVVMEPLRGGMLAKHVPASVQALYDAFPVKRSPVEWAFRYVYNRPEVKVVLSGISNDTELTDNVRIFSGAAENVMTAEELQLIEKVRLAYESLASIGCTGCKYCEDGCPEKITISRILRSYDEACVEGKLDDYAKRYRKSFVDKDTHGGKCIECGQCESACPQSLPIMKHLAQLHAKYGAQE